MNRLLLVDDDVNWPRCCADCLAQERFCRHLAHDGEAGAQEALSGQYASSSWTWWCRAPAAWKCWAA